MSRYCSFRYRVTKTLYRDFFPDIGTDIGKKNADIGTISGHTRSLPNPILPISGPISGFFPISVPISGQYRDIPVPCQTRYRVFHRYRARYGPDIAKNIGIYGYRNQKNPDVIPDVFAISQYTDIVYFRHRAFSLISGTIGGPPGPPAAQARRPLSRRSKWSSLLVLSSADQRGSALGTAYMLAHSVLLQKLPWSRVVQYTPSHWQNLKLETGIIEFQVAPFVTVVADIRGARYLLRVWWA